MLRCYALQTLGLALARKIFSLASPKSPGPSPHTHHSIHNCPFWSAYMLKWGDSGGGEIGLGSHTSTIEREEPSLDLLCTGPVSNLGPNTSRAPNLKTQLPNKATFALCNWGPSNKRRALTLFNPLDKKEKPTHSASPVSY